MAVNINAYRALFDRSNNAPGQDDEDWRVQMRRKNAGANVMVGNDTSAPSDNAPTPGTSITRPPAGDDPTNEEVLADAATNTPTSIVRRPVSPLESARQDAENQYVSAIRAPVQKQAWWKDALVKAAQVANNVFNPRNPVPIEGWGTVKHNKQVESAARVLGPLQSQYDTNMADRVKESQANAIPDRLKLQQDALDEKKQHNQTIAQRDFAKLQTFDPKNLAHRQLAKTSGLSDAEIDAMKGWDYKNPLEHMIDGERFRWDRKTGEYFPTNLPVDQEKSLVPFDVHDDQGNVIGTYNVTPDKAASLQATMERQGKSIQARKDIAAANNTTKKGIADASNALKQQALNMKPMEFQLKLSKEFDRAWKAQNGAKSNVPADQRDAWVQQQMNVYYPQQ